MYKISVFDETLKLLKEIHSKECGIFIRHTNPPEDIDNLLYRFRAHSELTVKVFCTYKREVFKKTVSHSLHGMNYHKLGIGDMAIKYLDDIDCREGFVF